MKNSDILRLHFQNFVNVEVASSPFLWNGVFFHYHFGVMESYRRKSG